MVGYCIVKTIPRLILLVIGLFFGLLLWYFGIGYLYLLVFHGVRIPRGAVNLQDFIQSHVWLGLVITLHGTAILGTTYAFRKHIPTALGVSLLLLILTILSITTAFVFERITPFASTKWPISSTIEYKTGTLLIFDSQKELIITPNKQPLVIQALLPKQSKLIDSILQDSRELGRQFAIFWAKGFLPFSVFIVCMLYFLTALGPIFSFSAWPLANLLLGLLFARFALWIQVFLFSEPVLQLISAIAKPIMPEVIQPYIALVSLFLLGTILHIFAILMYLSKDREKTQ